MKIIVDAMGGDLAPKEIVLGALDAVKSQNVEIVLVGKGEAILEVLSSHNIQTLPQGVEIANAEDVVDMHDDPTSVLKKRPDSSMVVGLKMLADGAGDAFVSAGSTGALLTAATLTVKRVKGIRRAAMGPTIPTEKGPCVIMDCGANAECTAEFLLQFAHMGSIYAEQVLGIENPRVALLNIGTEDTKGGALQREAYALLMNAAKEHSLNFIGNIEGRDVPLGGADVVVTDGFTGNVLLKVFEGTAIYLGKVVKGIFKKNVFTMLGALFCKSGINGFKKMMDYREVGGTPFIGLKKPVIKAHGSSDRRAIECAVRQAKATVQSGLCDVISDQIDQMHATQEAANVK
ncbi:MAG: phosphate acyltransferase PlsX [Oscillospiraceae bacterium]|nr:phosphate acyltransferase PlsX [Oscillospiraceae bacterium]